ncbi:MAG: 16S rRNA (cytidine(1402)-2'-O)-methyltransferase [Atopobiaceae bacterium]|jgi:16S rRNA (cytidine1402-2'-O)-methyltransferase|nr:16S rRNA (cytidine(1402)-2'-O)-methyltransferase [Atopobiaceae bacterium]
MADLPQPPRASGVLSLVGTPIGNLSDASPRALETLGDADVILCEDTRVTSKLCARFSIHTPLERCDENVIAERVPSVLARLASGARVAFVSDAGMPCVSDPGQRLVDAVLDQGLRVEVVPGPSAVSSALALSGLSSERFLFEGFLPRKASEQRSTLEALSSVPATLVIYESPRRVAKTLAAVAAVCPLRRVALVRELTKVHEEVVRARAQELADAIAARGEVKGECVVVVEAPGQDELAARRSGAREGEDRRGVDDLIAEGLAQGTPKSALAREVARASGGSRSAVYARIVELSREGR